MIDLKRLFHESSPGSQRLENTISKSDSKQCKNVCFIAFSRFHKFRGINSYIIPKTTSVCNRDGLGIDQSLKLEEQ